MENTNLVYVSPEVEVVEVEVEKGFAASYDDQSGKSYEKVYFNPRSDCYSSG